MHRSTIIVQLQHGKRFGGLDIRVKSTIVSVAVGGVGSGRKQVINIKKEPSWSQYTEP